MPGFQAINRFINPEQTVTIALTDFVIGIFFLAVKMQMLRKIINKILGQRRQIFDCCFVIRVRQTG
jgi:hypothetical protein